MWAAKDTAEEKLGGTSSALNGRISRVSPRAPGCSGDGMPTVKEGDEARQAKTSLTHTVHDNEGQLHTLSYRNHISIL